MPITHVTATLDPTDGGPAYSVPRLCGSLAANGADVALWYIASSASIAHLNGVDQRTFELARPVAGFGSSLARQLAYAPGFRRELRNRAAHGGILHVHGLWQLPSLNAAAAVAAPGASAKLVVSPRGMLSPGALRFSKRRKQLFWALAQRHALHQATVFHATAMSELEDIRAAGLKAPVAVVPNGVDLPPLEKLPARRASRTILSLGRIHPKKGLDRLIEAFAQLGNAAADWQVRLVGPAENDHDKELRRLIARLGFTEQQVSIAPPVFGDAKFREFRDAEIFVLPTLSENFGITVAEALACETPVIATKGAPWEGLLREGCGLWVDQGVTPLAQGLARLIALSYEERIAMGRLGRPWVARDFSWQSIARDILDVYRWADRGGEPPETIIT